MGPKVVYIKTPPSKEAITVISGAKAFQMDSLTHKTLTLLGVEWLQKMLMHQKIKEILLDT